MTRERPDAVEVEAPNLEDAIAEGLARLGARRHEVEVETLAEGRAGFFGIGAAPARVRVIRRGAAGRPRRGDRPRRDDRSRDGDARRPVAPADPAPLDREVREAADPAAAARAATGALRDLLAACGIPGEVDGAWDEAWGGVRLDLDVSEDDSALLVGRRGQTLNAFQYLTAVLAGRRIGRRVRVVLDLDGFRQRRAESLEGLARRAASEARRTGKVVDLDPMPPQDRRIIHLYLAGEDDIDVHSEGEGNRRHIVITPIGGGESARGRAGDDRPAGRSRDGGRRGGRRRGRGGRRAGATAAPIQEETQEDFVPPTDAAVEWIKKRLRRNS